MWTVWTTWTPPPKPARYVRVCVHIWGGFGLRWVRASRPHTVDRVDRPGAPCGRGALWAPDPLVRMSPGAPCGRALSYGPHAYNCPPCSRWVGYGRVRVQCRRRGGAPCGGTGEGRARCSVAGVRDAGGCRDYPSGRLGAQGRSQASSGRLGQGRCRRRGPDLVARPPTPSKPSVVLVAIPLGNDDVPRIEALYRVSFW